MSPRSAFAKSRRTSELGLGLLAAGIVISGYVLVALSKTKELPADLGLLCAVILGMFAVAHLAVRRFAPRADATLLPIAVLLNGFGFFVITRLDRDRLEGASALAPVQAVWTGVGIAAFVVTLVIVRRVRTLERYRYSFLLLGVAALLLPLAPGIGTEIRGARLWVRLGPLNFQPGEAAKLLLVVFFAAYLVDKRELLAAGSRRVGRLRTPRSEAPRSAAARVGSVDHRDGHAEGPRVVAAVLRALRRHALHGHRTGELPAHRVGVVPRGRRDLVPVLRARADPRHDVDRPVAGLPGQGLPARPVVVRVRHRWIRRYRTRTRQSPEDPCGVDRLRVRGDR